ncbi:MAG: peptidoglycan-binding protein [Henriciella sp.]|nr:peptidoglycan-binding protein [Henriciella sp.]
MSSYGSWSVKGIDDRARAVAKEKARLQGVTLGDYINDLLLQGHSEAGPREAVSEQPSSERSSPAPAPSERSAPLDSLARRIEAVEARSTLAITGIDQSVLGLLARLENTENTTSAIASEVESMIDELRETHEGLQAKVNAIEADDTGAQNLEAMKALEAALGKLAAHVYEENSLVQDETAAVKGRMEAGFSDLTDRVEDVEVKIETTLADAASRVEKAVEQAELRAEGTSKHLAERFTAIESGVATKLSKVDDFDARLSAFEGEVSGAVSSMQSDVNAQLKTIGDSDARLGAVEAAMSTQLGKVEGIGTQVESIQGDVSNAITSMEGTLLRIQERLNRAETATDAALMGLEQSFVTLDKRLDVVAQQAAPEHMDALRKQIEERFEGLAADLRNGIELSRQQLADEIEQAAAGANPELMGRLEASVDDLRTEIMAGEERSSRALDAMHDQVNRISTGLDTRLRTIEEREGTVFDQVSENMTALADQLEQHVGESEQRSAAAIEQVGAQVATAINRVQARQDEATQTLEAKAQLAHEQQDARLSKALTSISDRLNHMQSQTVQVMSPVQQAIASLAARLEAVEDFSTPPFANKPDRVMPDIPLPSEDTTPIEPEASADAEPEPVETVAIKQADDEDLDFLEGLPDFDADEPELAAEADTFEFDEDWPEAESEPENAYLTDEDAPSELSEEDEGLLASPVEDDPIMSLGDWDDGRDETRENDIFASEEEDIGEDNADEDVIELDIDEVEAASDEDEEEELPQVDEEATDYLSRARRAAILAASEGNAVKKSKPKSKSRAKSSRPEVENLVYSKENSSPLSGKVPLIAAASVLVLATASAGAYLSLRGKQSADIDPVSVATAASAADLETQAQAGASGTEPSLAGVEYADLNPAAELQSLEAELFEEGSMTPTAGETASVEVEPVVEPAPVALPTIPKRLTLQQAAEDGNPVAQFQWGEAALTAGDLKEGSSFVRRAAEQGLPAAQYRLAKLHEQGLGVPRDLVQARAWTDKAAVGGNVKAMHDLAVFFADGEGGTQSYAAAVEWFRKAAEFGLVDSQYNLGVMYENGLGISPSAAEALYWYEVAAKNGDASAEQNIAELRGILSPDLVATASERAESWTGASQNAASNGTFARQIWEEGQREQVFAVQTVLNGLGYRAGTPDGIAGAGTRTALRAFQADYGLPTDGQITDQVVDKLNELAKSAT